MGINDKIFVDQLVLPEGVTAVYDRNYVVLAILAGRGAKAGEEA